MEPTKAEVKAETYTDNTQKEKTELTGSLTPSMRAASRVKRRCTWPVRPAAAKSPVSDLDYDDVSDLESRAADDVRKRYTKWAQCRADVSESCNCLRAQVDITAKFRAVLVDWLIEVAEKFRLREETIFVTVAILDRYLSKVLVGRENLQLVGIAALLLASKFEELYAPSVEDLAFVSARTYSEENILQMETSICCKLGWQLPHVTAWTFLCAALALHVTFDTRNAHAAKYFVMRMLQEHSVMSTYSPSLIAHSAIMLTGIWCDERDTWDECVHRKPDCVLFSPHDVSALYECAHHMGGIIFNATSHRLQAVIKVSMRRFDGVHQTAWPALPAHPPFCPATEADTCFPAPKSIT